MSTQRMSPPAKAGSVPTPSWVAATQETRPGAPFSKRIAAAKARPVYLHRPTPGLPPPPSETFGNPELMALHAQRWFNNANVAFQPHRHTSMLNGRPWQCVVLTHNQAPSHEWYNHLADSMYPLRPICINGVTATGGEAGKMAKHYCVTQWWKWKGLPYMALPEHPEDQGFIVCESDFVFTQEEAARMTSAVDASASSNETLDARLEEMCAEAPTDTDAGRRFKSAVDD